MNLAVIKIQKEYKTSNKKLSVINNVKKSTTSLKCHRNRIDGNRINVMEKCQQFQIQRARNNQYRKIEIRYEK